MPLGYLALVLHAHLPFVRHPEFRDSFEEDWLYEAITETYIPLLKVMENFINEGVAFKLTLSLTPPLMEMLRDPFLQDRYRHHLELLVELSEKEVHRTEGQDDFHPLALMYYERLKEFYYRYNEVYKGDIVGAFARIQASGNLEIITSAATHAYLPLLAPCPQAVKVQLKVGVENYRKHLGRTPQGFWLPECGYYPGQDQYLAECGIKYFFLDTYGVLYANPRPKYAIYAPIFCESGVAAFGRDEESSKQVWSAREGYPGDFDYREFYRDIGYDLDFDYIKPYIHESGQRINTGLKYYRITGPSDYKEPYKPHWAKEKAARHAEDFLFKRSEQVKHLASTMDRPPLIISPYDAELFGHWWYEGPQWIDFLCRKIACNQDIIQMITPSEYLERYPLNQVAKPNMSSWGWRGYSEYWLNQKNDWIYRHLHHTCKRMEHLAETFPAPDALTRRALNQALREILLAQSSDWAFIMKSSTYTEYATWRTIRHLDNFNRLYEEIRHGEVDLNFLQDLEKRHNIFREIDYRVFKA
jgi:1,4-alpha-glucan branching enzyme